MLELSLIGAEQASQQARFSPEERVSNHDFLAKAPEEIQSLVVLAYDRIKSL